MERISTTTVFTCPICRRTSKAEIQLLFDSAFDEDYHYPTIFCPSCSASFRVRIPFVFWKRKPNNELFFVIPSERINDFQSAQKSQLLMLSDYRKQLSFADQKELKGAITRYCEAELLDAVISGSKREDFLLGIRNIIFTPALEIKPCDEYLYHTPETTLSLRKNEVSYCKSGLSEFGKELFVEVGEKLLREESGVQLSDYQKAQHTTTTMGFTEIALYVGSTIIIPVIVKVLGDVISEKIKKRKKEKDTKDDDTGLTIVIKENGTSNTYCFQGTPEKIVFDLRKFEQESISTVTIPNNCHEAVLLDDIVADSHLQGIKNLSESVKDYQKVFDIRTAVEIRSSSGDEIISAKAKFLMDKSEYKRAYYIMKNHIEKTTSIELLCNFAICLKHLEKNDEANAIFYRAITTYLNRPDLEDIEKFACYHSTEQLKAAFDKVDPIVTEEMAMLSDEEKEERAATIVKKINSVYDFDFEELCKEADEISGTADLL